MNVLLNEGREEWRMSAANDSDDVKRPDGRIDSTIPPSYHEWLMM